MTTAHRTLPRKIYDRMLAEFPDLTDPMSPYWQRHFQAAAKRLVEIMTVELYHVWFDKHFPDGQVHTWKAQFEAANAALWRIAERDGELRSHQIECELRVSLDEE
jgi:hypothetical protein